MQAFYGRTSIRKGMKTKKRADFIPAKLRAVTLKDFDFHLFALRAVAYAVAIVGVVFLYANVTETRERVFI